MKIINAINNGIDFFFAKMFFVIDWIRKKPWLKWLIVIFGAALISLVFYLIFHIGNGDPEVILYDFSRNSTQIKEVANEGRKFVRTINYQVVDITGWVLFGIALLLFSYIFFRKKLDYKWGLIFIVVIGVIARIVYTNVTDNIFTRQHDVWSSTGYYGHYGITMYLYNNGFILPPLKNGSLESSYQIYHPKFAHYSYALIMKIHSLFIPKARVDFTLYESVRIFTCTLSIINIYIGYSIFKELFKNKLAIVISTSVFAFAPSLIRLSSASNNDPLLYFFLFLSVMFAIRFYKRDGWVNIIGCAISIGMAMGSKLSGALIAIPIGILFIYKFMRIIADNLNDKEMLKRKLLKIILFYSVFLIICAPIGLFWPLYNLKEYHQPLSYVFHNLNQALLINQPEKREGYEVFTYAEMYLFFGFRTYFDNMFHIGFYSKGMTDLLDFNMYTNAFKTSIFGEFSYPIEQQVFCILLYVFGVILAFGALFFGLYQIVKSIVLKRYDLTVSLSLPIVIYYIYVFYKSKEIWGYVFAGILLVVLALLIYLFIKNYQKIHRYRLTLMFMGLIFVTFMLSFFDFQLQYPYTCTSDFRYITILLIPAGYVLGTIFTKYQNKKAIILPLIFVYALYSFGAIALNMSIQ